MRATTDFDTELGVRVKGARLAKGMTQRDFAAALGVTFQQVQKYERGANRIAASRLFHIGQVLDIDVAALFRMADPLAPDRQEELVGRFARLAEDKQKLFLDLLREMK